MSDTATLEAPTEVKAEMPPGAATQPDSATGFEAELARVRGEEATPDPAPKAKPEPKAKAPESTEKKSFIPDKFLSPEAETKKDDAILDMELPEGASEAQKGNFGKLKGEFQSRLKEMSERLAKAESGAGNPKEAAEWQAKVQALESRAAELEALVERTAIERSPKFQKQFVEKENGIRAQAEKVLKDAKVDTTVFAQALTADGRKRFEILAEADLNDGERGYLTSLLKDMDGLNAEKQRAVEGGKKLYTEWEQEQAAAEKQQAEARKQQEQRIYEKVGADVKNRFEAFQRVDGHPEWNAQVDQLEEQAKNFFDGKASIEELAELAYAGVAAKVTHSMFRASQKQNADLKAEVARLKAAEPNATRPGADKAAAALTPAESFERELARVRGE